MPLTGASPIQMQCEHPGCKSLNVKDYKRFPQDEQPGWKGEPIALCADHAGDRELILVNPYANVPKPSGEQHN